MHTLCALALSHCPTRPRLRRAAALLLGLCALWSAAPALALVVAPSAGQQVNTREERVVLVYDPLTATQTIVLQLEFDGTSTPFGLIIPTPKPATATVVSERLWQGLQRKLHPQGKVQRSLEFELGTWVGGCALRDVGDRRQPGESGTQQRGATAVSTPLGTASEPLHDWLLSHGLTISPAQAAWLARLRGLGWTLTAVLVRPPRSTGMPAPTLRSPVLALTHSAGEGPLYAAAHPGFVLNDQEDSPVPPLEIAVLTEWAVTPDQNDPADPFYARTILGQEVVRMGTELGSLPWAFRRDGSLTAFESPRVEGSGVLRFIRSEPYSPRSPAPTPRVRAYHAQIPIELIVLVLSLSLWGWRRFGSPQGLVRSRWSRKRRGRLL